MNQALGVLPPRMVALRLRQSSSHQFFFFQKSLKNDVLWNGHKHRALNCTVSLRWTSKLKYVSQGGDDNWGDSNATLDYGRSFISSARGSYF